MTPKSKTKDHSLLFLSCDLTGSTRFKQSQANRDLKSNEVPWQKTFLQFYWEFPQELALMQTKMETRNIKFSLWKAVGDELIMTCPVTTELEVNLAVRTWIATMTKYASDNLEGTSLGTKGGAFVATFPGPDSESSIPRDPYLSASGGDVIDLNRAVLASRRSHTNYLFDYFGPSIDTGFRVLSKCSSRYFTVSVEVAYALTTAHLTPGVKQSEFHCNDLKFVAAEALKGVWNDAPYPIFGIDTEYQTPLNQAFEKLSSTNYTVTDIKATCEACYESEGWPFHLYLPDSVDERFHAKPVDKFGNYKSESTLGSEKQTQLGNKELVDAPPTG